MAGNFYIPPEIIEEIILYLDPIHVASLAQCSSHFRSIVYSPNDQALWRSLYLEQQFDDPRTCVSQQGYQKGIPDWKGELQRFVRARSVLNDPSLCRPDERLTILKTLLEIVSYVTPSTVADSFSEISHNLLWVAAVLRGGVFLDRTESDKEKSKEEEQICARLHTHFGLTRADIRRSARVRSRAYVYDLRNYRWDNEFGPFDEQGCVDWVHMQALHHAVSMHLVDLQEDEDFEFAIFPLSIPFTQIVIPEGVNLDEEEDWAGVAGAWRVSFCFCDHRDLLRYNNADFIPGTNQLDPSIFEGPGFGEVFRSLDVEMMVTKTIYDPNHPKRPIICFVGEVAHSSSAISGQVKMTPDGQVRWQFVSGDQGNPLWSSVGVQVGGLRAAYGTLGAWTTVSHDADDPAGPFWLRKQQSSGVNVDVPINHVSLNSSASA